ncbi:hypothetical protein FRB94_011459 [Tulasnella sp. JGI-2019a]|nr:hypothetical protein FRB94_011459 [Tulasnella sp. JGI-2019a]
MACGTHKPSRISIATAKTQLSLEQQKQIEAAEFGMSRGGGRSGGIGDVPGSLEEVAATEAV